MLLALKIEKGATIQGTLGEDAEEERKSPLELPYRTP